MPAASGTRVLCPRLTSATEANTTGANTVAANTVGAGAIPAAAIGTSAAAARTLAAFLHGDPVPLPGTPWSVRPAAGPGARPAVEIYAAGCIVDVMVAPALAPRVLHGACSLAWAGQRSAVAWGFLPARPGLTVWFTRGPARRRVGPAQVGVIAGSFWFAPAGGRFCEVTVDHSGGRDRCRVRAARPC